jgi:hypothetical protein
LSPYFFLVLQTDLFIHNIQQTGIHRSLDSYLSSALSRRDISRQPRLAATQAVLFSYLKQQPPDSLLVYFYKVKPKN